MTHKFGQKRVPPLSLMQVRAASSEPPQAPHCMTPLVPLVPPLMPSGDTDPKPPMWHHSKMLSACPPRSFCLSLEHIFLPLLVILSHLQIFRILRGVHSMCPLSMFPQQIHLVGHKVPLRYDSPVHFLTVIAECSIHVIYLDILGEPQIKFTSKQLSEGMRSQSFTREQGVSDNGGHRH